MRLALLTLLCACAGKEPEDTGAPHHSAAHTGETGPADSGETGDTGTPFDCPERASGLVEVTTTPASPYLVRHPTAEGSESGPVVVFLGGGPGDAMSASVAWSSFLERADAVEHFWAIMPYTSDGSMVDEGDRIVAIVEEVLACYGGDPSRVHLAGTSNGGRAAFAIMLESPDVFATLLGAPGYFQETDTSVIASALAGKAVFNGVGEEDSEDWRSVVAETHELLTGLGIESVYDELEGQGHVPDASFDPSPLFEFWLEHE